MVMIITPIKGKKTAKAEQEARKNQKNGGAKNTGNQELGVEQDLKDEVGESDIATDDDQQKPSGSLESSEVSSMATAAAVAATEKLFNEQA